MFIIPPQVQEVLDVLTKRSFDAFLVGKCVRDTLMERPVMDYDVITDAPAERLTAIFCEYITDSTNIGKGELIVRVLGMAILVTPYIAYYREDGLPVYTENIVLDLARRKYNVNAIAYSPVVGFVDPFGGASHLKKDEGVIGIIGEEEYYTIEGAKNQVPIGGVPSALDNNPDVLAQTLELYADGDYSLAPGTAAAIHRKKSLINELSPEELKNEFCALLLGRHAATVLEEYADVIQEFIPEIAMLREFSPRTFDHCYDAWTHTCKAVGFSTPSLPLRLVLFFHDFGKPDCLSLDYAGFGHYYGYRERSVIYARRIMRRLTFNEAQVEHVTELLRLLDIETGDDKRSLKRTMRRTDPSLLKYIFQFRYANMRAKSENIAVNAAHQKELLELMSGIISGRECYNMQMLSVTKGDLLSHGICANEAEAGALLERLLSFIMDSPMYNTHNRLMNIAEKEAKKNAGADRINVPTINETP